MSDPVVSRDVFDADRLLFVASPGKEDGQDAVRTRRGTDDARAISVTPPRLSDRTE